MNAAEITTVEEAAVFFARMAQLFPSHKVVVRVEKRSDDGDWETTFNEPVRAMLNTAKKRVEIEVEP